MDYNKAALEMHESHKGKVGIVSKVEVATRDDLSTAYTPGVAEPCRKIKANPEDVYKYTCLLYTSPSPRDAHESRMPSSA